MQPWLLLLQAVVARLSVAHCPVATIHVAGTGSKETSIPHIQTPLAICPARQRSWHRRRGHPRARLHVHRRPGPRDADTQPGWPWFSVSTTLSLHRGGQARAGATDLLAVVQTLNVVALLRAAAPARVGRAVARRIEDVARQHVLPVGEALFGPVRCAAEGGGGGEEGTHPTDTWRFSSVFSVHPGKERGGQTAVEAVTRCHLW